MVGLWEDQACQYNCPAEPAPKSYKSQLVTKGMGMTIKSYTKTYSGHGGPINSVKTLKAYISHNKDPGC